MAVQRERKVRRIVHDVLVERFADVIIVDIKLSEREDRDGNAFINIYVVFEGKEKDLDASKISGLARIVLPKLEEADEHAFPIFSFVSKSDWGKLSHALA